MSYAMQHFQQLQILGSYYKLILDILYKETYKM